METVSMHVSVVHDRFISTCLHLCVGYVGVHVHVSKCIWMYSWIFSFSLISQNMLFIPICKNCILEIISKLLLFMKTGVKGIHLQDGSSTTIPPILTSLFINASRCLHAVSQKMCLHAVHRCVLWIHSTLYCL